MEEDMEHGSIEERYGEWVWVEGGREGGRYRRPRKKQTTKEIE